eukprot:1161778-Pelagomonas_calceolata.AAC.2
MGVMSIDEPCQGAGEGVFETGYPSMATRATCLLMTSRALVFRLLHCHYLLWAACSHMCRLHTNAWAACRQVR